ncbi:hypothetical protein FIU87_04955 [Bacillus sp. THAF10]|uniref:DUF2268 domain-containing protein n=1 Tax=Bacillus sp. THAF10 TaxID=2587848 RepID=UPI001268A161|nr:DUF2268 domain-containing putative Zn-dependent protease [Bacillus sp. THAF10]QFT87999.1 hypothetical protein FIU87_04955 [Bacillus sp. THAF10]
MRKLSIIIMMFLILAGCTKTIEETSLVEGFELKNTQAYSVSVNGQHVDVIPLFEPYMEYISSQREKKGNREDVFSELVTKEISQEIYGSKYYLQNDLHFIVPSNIDKLEHYIKNLDEKFSEIKNIIEKSIGDSSRLLSGSDYKIYLTPYNPDISSLDMEGVAGFATDKGAMLLQIDPDNYTENSIKQTIAHEYHHLVYMEISDYKIRKHNLMELVMMEGKADSFTKLVYPDYEVGWIEPLSENEQGAIRNYLDKYQSSYDLDHYYQMRAGIPSSGIPKWALYRVGYQMMQEYLEKNNELATKDWSLIKAAEILEQLESDKP